MAWLNRLFPRRRRYEDREDWRKIAKPCVDCAGDFDERYMVKCEIWAASGLARDGGVLCIGCLERRLGRRLTPDDFDPGWRANSGIHDLQSLRLRDRAAPTEPTVADIVDCDACDDSDADMLDDHAMCGAHDDEGPDAPSSRPQARTRPRAVRFAARR